MMEYVSIIVPVYNLKDYISECIESLIRQTYSYCEIIVVDDGSNDGTEHILDDYEKNRDIKIYHTENRGVSGARNYGIKRAKGKWIAFVDGDDFVEETYIETLVSALKKNKNCELAICNHYEFGEQGIRKGIEWFGNYENTEENDIQKLIKKAIGISVDGECGRHFGAVWSRLYELKIINDNNICFNEGIVFGEDLLFNMQYLRCIKNTGIIHKHLYNYRMRYRSASRKSNDSAKYWAFLDCYLDMVKDIFSTKEYKALSDFMIIHLIYKMLSGKPRIYRKDIDYLLEKNKNFKEVIVNPCLCYFDLKKRVLLFLIRYRMCFFLRGILWIKDKREGIL